MTHIYERQYPCPCSRSTVTTTTVEGPHSGTSTTYHIDCRVCEKAYRIVQVSARHIHKFPSPFTMYVRVVPTAEALLFEELQQELYQLQSDIIEHSRTHHLAMFMQVVLQSNNKKTIWLKLQEVAGEPTRTLKAFYRYTHKRIEEIVRSHFTLERLPLILKNLQLQDAVLEQRLKRSVQVQHQIELLETDMVDHAYRLEAGVTVQ